MGWEGLTNFVSENIDACTWSQEQVHHVPVTFVVLCMHMSTFFYLLRGREGGVGSKLK